MKRGTILLFLFVLMLSLSACSTSANKETSEYATTTEPIELHSGVTFGMSSQQIIQKENENGYSTEFRDDGRLQVTGKIAGFDSSMIQYFFDSSSMFHAMYTIGDSSITLAPTETDFQTIQTALEAQYGKPTFSSAMGTATNLPGKYKNQYVTGIAWAEWGNMPSLGIYCEVVDYYQWEIKQPDGSVVLIDHFLAKDLGNYAQRISYVCYASSDVTYTNQQNQSIGNDL